VPSDDESPICGGSWYCVDDSKRADWCGKPEIGSAEIKRDGVIKNV